MDLQAIDEQAQAIKAALGTGLSGGCALVPQTLRVVALLSLPDLELKSYALNVLREKFEAGFFSRSYDFENRIDASPLDESLRSQRASALEEIERRLSELWHVIALRPWCDDERYISYPRELRLSERQLEMEAMSAHYGISEDRLGKALYFIYRKSPDFFALEESAAHHLSQLAGWRAQCVPFEARQFLFKNDSADRPVRVLNITKGPGIHFAGGDVEPVEGSRFHLDTDDIGITLDNIGSIGVCGESLRSFKVSLESSEVEEKVLARS